MFNKKLIVWKIVPLPLRQHTQFPHAEFYRQEKARINLIAKPRRDYTTFCWIFPRAQNRQTFRQRIFAKNKPLPETSLRSRLKFPRIHANYRCKNFFSPICLFCFRWIQHTPVLSHANRSTDQIWLLLNKFYLLCRYRVECMNTLLFLYLFCFSKDVFLFVTSRTVNQCKLDSLSAKQRMLKLH